MYLSCLMHKRANILHVNFLQVGCSEQSNKTHNFRKIIFVMNSMGKSATRRVWGWGITKGGSWFILKVSVYILHVWNQQVVRLEERNRYMQVVAQFTSVNLPLSSGRDLSWDSTAASLLFGGETDDRRVKQQQAGYVSSPIHQPPLLPSLHLHS